LSSREYYEDEDHETRTARDGGDGDLAYLHFRPDLVITDIQMPRKDGFQLMKDIGIPSVVAAGWQVHATGKNNGEGETPLSAYLPFLATTYNTGEKNHD